MIIYYGKLELEVWTSFDFFVVWNVTTSKNSYTCSGQMSKCSRLVRLRLGECILVIQLRVFIRCVATSRGSVTDLTHVTILHMRLRSASSYRPACPPVDKQLARLLAPPTVFRRDQSQLATQPATQL